MIIIASMLIAACRAAEPVQTVVSSPLVLQRISSGELFPTVVGPGSEALLSNGNGADDFTLCVAPAGRPVANGIQILGAGHDGSALPTLNLDVDPEWCIRACIRMPPPSDSTRDTLAVLGQVVSRRTDPSGGLHESVAKQALFVVDVDRSVITNKTEWSGSEFAASAVFPQGEAAHMIVLLGRGAITGVADLPCIERRAWPGLDRLNRRRVSDELDLDSFPARHRGRRDPRVDQVLISSDRGVALFDTEGLMVEEIEMKSGGLTPCYADEHFDWDGDGVDDMLVLRRSTSSLEPLSSPSSRLIIVSGKSRKVIAEIAKGAQSGIGTVLNAAPIVVFTTDAGVWTLSPSGSEVLHPDTGEAHTIPVVCSHRTSDGRDASIHLGIDRWKDLPPNSGAARDSVEIWRITQGP